MDYRNYSLSILEKGKIALFAVVVSVGIAYLFFENLWFTLIFPLVYGILRKMEADRKRKKRQQDLCSQFIESMKVVSSSLLAGFSLENAWLEAEREVEILYGCHSYMYLELREMNRLVSLNIPLEQELEKFARRTGVEDIISFSEVFLFAKRAGGNFAKIIESTIRHMHQKYETEQEIQVMIASRRLEQKIMDVIPIGILAYLKLTAKDYLQVLYGNMAGALFMFVCLCFYLFALYLADKILTVKV